MKGSGAALLVIIGFVLLFAALTGRLDCFVTFWQCLTTGAASGTSLSDIVSKANAQTPSGTVTRSPTGAATGVQW